jgi:coproporphyrinogen III oxidase
MPREPIKTEVNSRYIFHKTKKAQKPQQAMGLSAQVKEKNPPSLCVFLCQRRMYKTQPEAAQFWFVAGRVKFPPISCKILLTVIVQKIADCTNKLTIEITV